MTATKDNSVVQAYLFFNGRYEEAIEFYRKALGAEVDMLMRFKDSPEPQQPGMVGRFREQGDAREFPRRCQPNHGQ